MASGGDDVIVVGAGPTGLLLAGDLAVAGVSVTVVEKRPAGLSNLTRAFGVHTRTLEQFDARGLADDLLRTGEVISELRFFGSVSFDISRLPSRFPYLLVTPQYEVEKVLLRRAQDNGVTFRHGTEVLGLARDDSDDRGDSGSGVRVRVRDEAGTVGTLRAGYLVGADGVHSAVRHALGLPFPGHAVIRSVALADVRLAEEPRRTVSVSGTGNAFGFMSPFGDGYWRVGAWERTRTEVAPGEPVEFEELRAITERAFGTDFGMHDARWISRFQSDERQVPRYRVGRVLLAGDAAHTHSPAGGQGMNVGLQDAANLGWKLAAVVRGWAPHWLLDSYHTERHPVGRSVLRSSGAHLRLAMAHNPLQRAARSALGFVVGHLPPVRRRAIGQITGIGYRYPAPRGAHPLTGTRMPDAELAGGRLYEALRTGRFVLVTPSPAEPGRIGRADRLAVRQWADDRRSSVLVRPDGYVAWACEHADAAQAEAAVAEWTGH